MVKGPTPSGLDQKLAVIPGVARPAYEAVHCDSVGPLMPLLPHAVKVKELPTLQE